MDSIYAAGLSYASQGEKLLDHQSESKEATVRSESDGKLIAQAFQLSKMELGLLERWSKSPSRLNLKKRGEGQSKTNDGEKLVSAMLRPFLKKS